MWFFGTTDNKKNIINHINKPIVVLVGMLTSRRWNCLLWKLGREDYASVLNPAYHTSVIL